MSMRALLKRYIKDQNGSMTISFVSVSLAMFLMMFFVVEMTLAYFSIQSSQKAAQMGVRLAAVSDPMVAGLPTTNGLVVGELFGTNCGAAPTPCTDFGTLTCTGAACEADAFNRMLGRMQGFLAGLQAQHVTVSYSYQALGFAGGPVIPAITVTISGVPYQTGVIGRLLGAGGGDLSTLPAVSATVTGEDLSESGA